MHAPCSISTFEKLCHEHVRVGVRPLGPPSPRREARRGVPVTWHEHEGRQHEEEDGAFPRPPWLPATLPLAAATTTAATHSPASPACPAIATRDSTRALQVIKPFKVKPKLPENFEESSWQKLQVWPHASVLCHHRATLP